MNETTSTANHVPQFSSRFGFLAAAVGSAIGIGNIWRFPFVVGENGGGAFLIPYLIALVVLGGPILAIELAAGRESRGGVVATFASIRSRARWIGLLIALGSLALLSYYLVVTGWAVGYTSYAVVDNHPRFRDFTDGPNSMVFFAISLGLTTTVVAMGVNGGIERISRTLMPVMIAVLLGLVAYAMTLEGRDDALAFYLKPDFAVLVDATTWVRAFGQVFFSLGVGMGVLITYGAYVSDKEDLQQSAAMIAVADSLIAFMAGLVVFPLVFTLGGEPAAGPELAFDTLPRAFESLPSLARYSVATLFYLLLSVAAITSAVALLETAVVGLRDATGIRRSRGLMIAVAVIAVAGSFSALSYTPADLMLFGDRVLDTMDLGVGTFGLPLGVLATAVVLGWFGPALLAKERGPAWAVALWVARWLIPVAIGLVLLGLAFDALLRRVVPDVAG